MKRRVVIAVAAIAVCAMLAGAFAACTDPYENPVIPDEWGDVLIVYFSKTGTTEGIAEYISELMPEADVFEVERLEPYPDEYTPTTEVARDELDANARPELAEYLSDEQVAQYETILFGFPIWWHEAPMPMFTFLDRYDLTGKNLITFCTSASSSISETTPMIIDNAHGATVYEGERFSSRSDIDDVREWLTELGLVA